MYGCGTEDGIVIAIALRCKIRAVQLIRTKTERGGKETERRKLYTSHVNHTYLVYRTLT